MLELTLIALFLTAAIASFGVLADSMVRGRNAYRAIKGRRAAAASAASFVFCDEPRRSAVIAPFPRSRAATVRPRLETLRAAA